MSDSQEPTTKTRWIDAWTVTLLHAAYRLAANPPFRGYVQKPMSPRQQARARGFSNAAALAAYVARMTPPTPAQEQKVADA